MSQKEFEKFQASSLYCQKCKQATEVREKLLLILPEGNLFDYICSVCGTSVGKRTEKKNSDKNIILAAN